MPDAAPSVATPPSPAAQPPAHTEPQQQGPQQTVTRKSYGTQPKASRAAAAAVAAANSAQPVTAPLPTQTASPKPAAEVTPKAPAAPPPAADTPAADSAPAAKDAQATDAASTPTKTPDELEIAKRLAAVQRAEGKLVEKQLGHRADLDLAAAVKQALPQGATPQAVAQALQRVALVQQAAGQASQDPLGFLHRVFGVDPQDVMRKVIDAAIGETGKKPEQRAADAVARAEQAAQNYQKAIDEAATREQQERQSRQIADYQERTLAPIVNDAAKYPHLRRYCEMNRADPVRELYNAMNEIYTKTGSAPDPRLLAEQIEGRLSGFVKLPEASASLGGKAAQAKVEPPPADKGSQRATTAPVVAASFKRQKLTGKPYSSKPR